MFKKKRVILSIFVVFLFSNLNAKDILLEELINIAIENNSDIKISKYKEEIKDANYENSKAGYLPKVSAVGEVAKYDIKGSNSNQVEDNVTGFSLSANQLIYDFGKTSNIIDSAKEDYLASNFEIVKNISFTVLKIKEAYYNILSSFQQINLAKESIKIDELHLVQAEKYYKAGVRTLIDVTDAQLKLSNSKLELIQAQYNLKNAQTKLISILGIDESKKIDIKNAQEITSLAKSLEVTNLQLENLLSKGYENRPELKMFEKQINAQKLKLKSNRAEYYPRVDFDATYSDKDSDKIVSVDVRQATAGVYLKWDLYTGDSTQANIKSSLASLNSLKQQLTQEKLQIKEDITNAYFKLKESEESINIALLSVDLSTVKLDLANKRYQAGLNDLVELNESKLQYTQAKSNLINTYYSYLSSKANLDYVIGVIY
ncbi:MAG: TolC family protein [Arcobacter sp.]|jgi:outer membrane protein TolC|uniref:TolC family protein n=1 Tax=Arcobacter sp. TaxID=1872629 RepID=UPI002A762986|nr:TolC family protein [Arcobacter sp.]MDY3204308.1 TolC family protein [Arcobacter sp.]